MTETTAALLRDHEVTLLEVHPWGGMGVDVLRPNLRGKLCSLCIGYMLSFTIRKSGNQTVRERSSIAETLDRLKRTVCLANAVLEFFKKRKRER